MSANSDGKRPFFERHRGLHRAGISVLAFGLGTATLPEVAEARGRKPAAQAPGRAGGGGPPRADVLRDAKQGWVGGSRDLQKQFLRVDADPAVIETPTGGIPTATVAVRVFFKTQYPGEIKRQLATVEYRFLDKKWGFQRFQVGAASEQVKPPQSKQPAPPAPPLDSVLDSSVRHFGEHLGSDTTHEFIAADARAAGPPQFQWAGREKKLWPYYWFPMVVTGTYPPSSKNTRASKPGRKVADWECSVSAGFLRQDAGKWHMDTFKWTDCPVKPEGDLVWQCCHEPRSLDESAAGRKRRSTLD